MRAPAEKRTSRRPTEPSPGITIRLATPADAGSLERLAQLDSAGHLEGAILVAEASGELRAAVSLADAAVIADPFHRTAEIVAALRAQRCQVVDERPPSRWRRVVEWAARDQGPALPATSARG